jgi:hypothetical protein
MKRSQITMAVNLNRYFIFIFSFIASNIPNGLNTTTESNLGMGCLS